MEVIKKILQRAQHLQCSCFGTPVFVTIEISNLLNVQGQLPVPPHFKVPEKVSPTVICGKKFVLSSFVDMISERFIFDTTMSDQELYEEWGRAKDCIDRALDKHVGHRVTSAGKIKNKVNPERN